MADSVVFFFFKDTATTEIYTYLHTLSLHDALPICMAGHRGAICSARATFSSSTRRAWSAPARWSAYCPMRPTPAPRSCWSARSEEHTSELQSLMRISYAVFCLKKKTKITKSRTHIHYKEMLLTTV